MKKIFYILAGLLFFSGCSKGTDGGYKKISSNEAMEIMKTETDFVILDVRTNDEFKEGHVVNAINIPNEIIDEDVSETLKDKDQLILVYCRSGNRSRQAAEKLIKFGYKNVVDFGGIQSYQGEIVKD